MGLLDFLTKGSQPKKAPIQGTPVQKPQGFSGYTAGQARSAQSNPVNPTARGYNLPELNSMGGISSDQFSDVKYPLPTTEIPQVPVPSQPTTPLPPGVAQTANNFTDIYGNPISEMPDISKMDYSDPSKHPVIPEVNPGNSYTTYNEGVKMTSFDAPQVTPQATELPQSKDLDQLSSALQPELTEDKLDLTQNAPMLTESIPMVNPLDSQVNSNSTEPKIFPSANIEPIPTPATTTDFSDPMNSIKADEPVAAPSNIVDDTNVQEFIQQSKQLDNSILTNSTPTQTSELNVLHPTQVPVPEPQPAPEIDKAMEELNKTINNIEAEASTAEASTAEASTPLTPVVEQPAVVSPSLPELPVPEPTTDVKPELTPIMQPEIVPAVADLVPEPVLDEPKSTEVAPILETQTLPELPDNIQNNTVQETTTPETLQSFNLNVLNRVGFIGLNSDMDNNILEMIKSFLNMSKNNLTKVNLDSTKSYAKDIVDSLASSKVTIDGFILKPYYTNYSDESDKELGGDNLTLRYYSNYFERLEEIYKESDFFIIPTQKGLVNFASLNTLVALGHMYFGLHKPIFLLGSDWEEYNTYLNSKVASEPNENPFVICATMEDLKSHLLRLDDEYSEKEKVNQKRNVIDNRKGHEEAEFLVK